MSAVHPDKSGGSFDSDQDKALFMRTKTALDYLELQSQSSLALIPLSQMPAIVNAVSLALAARPVLDSQALESKYVADAKARISERFVPRKIGSGAFAAITAFLVAFPDKFEKHLILGPILGGEMAQIALLTIWAPRSRRRPPSTRRYARIRPIRSTDQSKRSLMRRLMLTPASAACMASKRCRSGVVRS